MEADIELNKEKAIFDLNFNRKNIFLNKIATATWLEDIFEWLFCTKIEYTDFQNFKERKMNYQKLFQVFLLN